MEINTTYRIFPSIDKNRNDHIRLILHGGIVIPVEHVFVDKLTLGPGALMIYF